MKLSVVVPVYNEEGNLPEYLAQTLPILREITDDYEVIFAVDPSTDQTEQVILDARAENPRIKMLRFSRRFGQPMATLAGLKYTTGDAVIVMDVDLQDPPSLIPVMVEKLEEGYDVVMPRRRSRAGETAIKRAVSYVGYKLINAVSLLNIPRNTGDFRLMSRRVVGQINAMHETHGFLRGMAAYAGFKQTTIEFDRPARFTGKGHYNRFMGSLRIGFNGLFCYSNHALGVSTVIGLIIAMVSFLLAVTVAVMKLCGFPFPLGIPTVVILILFIGGVQLVSIGVLGEYIGRIYEEVRSRPRYIIEQADGFEEADDQ